MSNQEVRDVLERAAKRISEKGWWQVQGDTVVGRGSCVVTAIAHSSGLLDDTFEAACIAVERWLGVEHLTDWNDTPGRLQIEVETALRDTAMSLEEVS